MSTNSNPKAESSVSLRDCFVELEEEVEMSGSGAPVIGPGIIFAIVYLLF